VPNAVENRMPRAESALHNFINDANLKMCGEKYEKFDPPK
jgi:hypothetical protein